MHIYIFGSICRKDNDHKSDIDILVCLQDDDFDKIKNQKISIYSYNKLKKLWIEGNPFAWHLFLESKMIYSQDGLDYIKSLGIPNTYKKVNEDIKKFKDIFNNSKLSLTNSLTFNLSCIFLAFRNIATCYSLHIGEPCFSRRSAKMISHPLPINDKEFSIFERARILSTRGIGERLTKKDIKIAINCFDKITKWIIEIEEKVDGIQFKK